MNSGLKDRNVQCSVKNVGSLLAGFDKDQGDVEPHLHE